MSQLDQYRNDMANTIQALETHIAGSEGVLHPDIVDAMRDVVSEWDSMDGEISEGITRISELEDTEEANEQLEDKLSDAMRTIEERDGELDQLTDRICHLEEEIDKLEEQGA